MVGASDVDSSSAYSSLSSSSSEVEGDRRKNNNASKNLIGLSCFAGDSFCVMAHSSGSQKSHQSDSDSYSKDEVLTSFPSCVRRMSVLASCLITMMTCLEKPRR
jgi:hypothetical protein